MVSGCIPLKHVAAMTHLEWMLQARFWRFVSRRVPTCFLQWELGARTGVTAEFVAPDQERSYRVSGPCWVTRNVD